MTTAIICLTDHGYQLGLRVKKALLKTGITQIADLYAPAKKNVDPAHATIYHEFAPTVQNIFNRYQKIVFIMALGIVVRTIAPLIKNKTVDPAVIVMDEAGQNVISCLSGHLGGANKLAVTIAAELGIRPVVTTATDVHGLPAVDDLAREFGWVMEPMTAIKNVNSCLVNGDIVHFYTSRPLPFTANSKIKIFALSDYQYQADRADYNVVVTNRLLGKKHERTMFLRPRNLVAGIGCRSGVCTHDLFTALQAALKQCQCSILSLRALATIELKSAEKGLNELAVKLKLPLLCFTAQEINDLFLQSNWQLSKSAFVEKNIGVPGVCEPAALLATGEGELILPKQKSPGVTLAIGQDR